MGAPRTLSVEIALGDGDCLFNAFALAISEKSVADKIKKPEAEFVSVLGKVLLPTVLNPTWDVVKLELIRRKNEDKEALQKALALSLRQLSIAQTKNPMSIKGRLHASESGKLLFAEMGEYFSQTLGGEQHKFISDVYGQHSFIKDKFLELYNAAVADPAREKFNGSLPKIALEDWWKTTGHAEFLTQMSLPGKWAGDLELASLAEGFGVNVEVVSKARQINHRVYDANGVLSEGLAVYFDALRDRGIITSDSIWKELSEKQVRERLDAIPDESLVKNYIVIKKPENNSPVPAEWTNETVEQLKARGLVASRRGKDVFTLDLKADEAIDNAFKRISKAEAINADMILIERKKVYRDDVPTIVLANENAIHWNNTINTVQDKRVATKKEFVATDVMREANQHVDEIFEALQQKEQTGQLSNADVIELFEKAFDHADKAVNDSNGDIGFFKTRFESKKQEVLTEVTTRVTRKP